MFERLALKFSNSENYLDIFLLSVFFTVLSVILVHRLVSFQVGQQNLGGVIAVLMTSLAVSYPFIRYLLEEEKVEISRDWEETKLLERHAHQLELYLSFFLGSTLGFAISTFLVPKAFYTVQNQVLETIRSPTGMVISNAVFEEILRNNLWVFSITFVLAFFISSGILFILAWNASVLGVLIGNLAGSAVKIPVITAFYLPHGLLEIGGYVLAGIAGSLLSYSVESEVMDENTELLLVTKDTVLMLVIGVVFILIAAVIEVI
ncbi:MAG: stage II sporulation protein M [Candidatus Nanohaloarchaeota archaeon QJJ-7]|nr:stage II sporulation protein M [Candidatus Nanohaloarchaeota archaeon QJJ-7]